MAGIAIFGGSFDPIHCVHLALAECARDQMRLDGVLFVPARQNPHKADQPIASDADRLRMTELAVEGIEYFAVDDREVHRDGWTVTIDTVESFAEDRIAQPIHNFAFRLRVYLREYLTSE